MQSTKVTNLFSFIYLYDCGVFSLYIICLVSLVLRTFIDLESVVCGEFCASRCWFKLLFCIQTKENKKNLRSNSIIGDDRGIVLVLIIMTWLDWARTRDFQHDKGRKRRSNQPSQDQ